MKTMLRLLSLAAIAAVVCALPVALLAQAADPSAIVSTDTAAGIATPFVVALALKYPVIITILAAVGTLRFFFKPVVSLIEAYVQSTPSPADDEAIAKVEASAPWKWFCWALDFFCSIKVGPQFTAKPQA
ncbi:MAG: hypothetical protein PHE83_05800 [Opitutaceae bacterium]|nr:hypothetical protein [Opitutaceae bacterium]